MPQVPAVDFHAQWDLIGDDVVAATRRVGESAWYVLGDEVEAFEDALAAHAGVAHVVGCGSGLDAIELGLRAAGLQPGALVATTPMSAFATALAIVRAGGRPVYVDTDDSGLIDLEALEDLVTHEDVRAVVPVHLYGHVVSLGELDALVARHDLLLVEDAAQALGAGDATRRTGQRSIAATSFYPTKNLGALGDGGAVLTDDAGVAATARQLRDYGQTAKYRHELLGLNSRLDEIHAAILRSALLPRLDAFVQRRREIASRYLEGLANPRIDVRAPAFTDGSVWHLFPVFAPDEAARDALQAHLSEAGVGSAVHYPALLPDQGAWGDGRRDPVAWPIADRLTRTELSLPMHPFLSDEQVEHAIEVCNRW